MTTENEPFEYEPDLIGSGLRIAIVVGRFNQDVGDGLLSACTAELGKLGVAGRDIEIVTVPGALEIPRALQRLPATGRFDALVALGPVIRGSASHFEHGVKQSEGGVTPVHLGTRRPSAILP